MKVYIERTKQRKKLKFAGSAGQLLEKLEINKEAVIVTRDNVLITLETELNDSDEINVLSVISGG